MRDYLGASELGSCARRVFYAHREEFQDAKIESKESLRVMGMGTYLEEMVLNEYHDMIFGEGSTEPPLLGKQMEVTFGPCKGHLDAYIEDGGEKIVLDSKVTTYPNMKKWAKEGLPSYYQAQGQAYMAGLGACEARFIAMDRMSGKIEVFTLRSDPEAQSSLLRRAEVLSKCITEGPMPDGEYESNSTQCKWCPWKKTCWGTFEAELSEASEGRIVDATDWPGFEDWITQYEQGTEQLSTAKELQDEAKYALVALLREHKAKGATTPGLRVYQNHITQDKFSTKLFHEKEPTLWDKYKTQIEFDRLEVRRVK